jgi:hypothetical protein
VSYCDLCGLSVCYEMGIYCRTYKIHFSNEEAVNAFLKAREDKWNKKSIPDVLSKASTKSSVPPEK